MQHTPFLAIRKAEGATPQRNAYKTLRESDGAYADLPAVTRADDIWPALDEWERTHQAQCELGRDDGQFLGFSNVAKGSLAKATTFVFIPAVRDASQDAVDGKGSPVARLMELVVRSAIQQRNEIRQWQERINTEYRDLTNPEKLTELGALSGELSTTLQMFYRDAGVDLQWKPAEDFSIPLPAADVFLEEEGFKGPVDRKGHGLQRALVLTLLQHLAKAVASSQEQSTQVWCMQSSARPSP